MKLHQEQHVGVCNILFHQELQAGGNFVGVRFGVIDVDVDLGSSQDNGIVLFQICGSDTNIPPSHKDRLRDLPNHF
jgi:hypothetical protein